MSTLERKRSSNSRRSTRSKSKSRSKARSNSKSRSNTRRRSSASSSAQSTNSLISATALDALFVAGGKKHGVDGKLRVKASAGKEREVVHAAVMDTFKVQPSPPGGSRPQRVLLGILTTAPIETMGVMSALKDPVAHSIPVGVTTWDCYVGTLFGVRAVVVKSDQGPSGSHGSINATSFLISQWAVKTIWAVGIALGADPKNQKHGDVLAATAVQVYETREKTGADGKKDITLSHAPWTVSKELKSVVESTCASWKSGENKGHAGLVVSAPKLLDDAGATTEQLNVVRKAVPNMPVIGGEMEMGGVISVSLGAGVPWGIVKGICDFGGLDKAKSKEWQPLATMNAVAWMGAAIGNGSWIRSIPTPALSALHVMSFDEYMEKKRDGFVGRTELFGKMEAFSGGRVLLIKGEAGIGKSALMSQFVARNEDNGKIMALHFCQFGDGSTLDSERWLRSVTGQIMRWASQHNISIPDEVIGELLDDATPISSRFQAFSHAFPKSAPAGTDSVWIVVDSLDEAVQAGGARSGFDIVRAIGRAEFPSWIRIVASTRSDPTVMSALEREIKDVVVMESSSEENMRDLRTWLTTAGGVTKESTLKAVLDASGGNFLYVRQLVVDGDVEKRVNSLPSGLVGIYSARAKALWEDLDEFEGDVPVLSVLVAARAPVPLDLLKVAAKSAAGGRVNVKRIVEYLKSVLDVGRDGAVRVFHKSFVDWCVSVGYEGVKAEIKRGDMGLATAGMELWESGNVYAVRHTLVHAHSAGLNTTSMTSSWKWMHMRADLDGWFEVSQDVNLFDPTVSGIIRRNMSYGSERVALDLLLYGDVTMRSPLKAFLGLAPTNRAIKPGKALLQRYAGHEAGLNFVASLPRGLIATGADDETIRIWDRESGECLRTMPCHISLSMDALGPNWFVSGSFEEDLRIWDTATWECVQTITGEHRLRITLVLALDEDGSTFVSGDYGGRLVLWRRGADGRWAKSHELPTQSDDIVDGVITAFGRSFITADSKGLVSEWDLSQNPPVLSKSLTVGHRIVRMGRAWDGSLVTTNKKGLVEVWQADLSAPAKLSFETGEKRDVYSMAVLQSDFIVLGSERGMISAWSLTDGTPRGSVAAHTLGIQKLIPSPHSPTAFFSTGEDDKTAALWNVAEFPVPGRIRGHLGQCTCGGLMTDSRLVSGGDQGDVVIWQQPKSGELPKALSRVVVGTGRVQFVVGVRGGFAAWCDDADNVSVWNETAGGKFEPGRKLPGVEMSLRGLLCLPDGETLFGVDDDSHVFIWSAKSGKRLRTVELSDEAWSLELVNPSTVAVGCDGGSIAMINNKTGTEHVVRFDRSVAGLRRGLAHLGDNAFLAADTKGNLWMILKGASEASPPVSAPISDSRHRVLASLPDGGALVANGNDLVLWGRAGLSKRVKGLRPEEVSQAVVDRSRQRLVLFCKDGWLVYEL